MPEDRDVVVVQRYTSEIEAQVARLVLEAHDIPCALMRDDAGGMIPSMQLIYPVRLLVRGEDADEARRVLATEPGRDPDAPPDQDGEDLPDESVDVDDPNGGWRAD